MRIPLSALASRATNRRKPITLPPINPTIAQADKLAALYMSVVRAWVTGSKIRIIPTYSRTLAYFGDSVDDIQNAINATEQGAVTAQFTFAMLFQEWAGAVQLWHMRRLISQLKYATNVDLSSLIGPADARVTLESALAQNVSLVRSVSDDIRNTISGEVFRGLQNRVPMREVAREINVAVQIGAARSRRIASDQLVKLSSQLDRERQEQLGITSFEWKHSGKAHPRKEHLARNGKVFEWDSAVGRDDPPGRAPFCGCKARGVVEIG